MRASVIYRVIEVDSNDPYHVNCYAHSLLKKEGLPVNVYVGRTRYVVGKFHYAPITEGNSEIGFHWRVIVPFIRDDGFPLSRVPSWVVTGNGDAGWNWEAMENAPYL